MRFACWIMKESIETYIQNTYRYCTVTMIGRTRLHVVSSSCSVQLLHVFGATYCSHFSSRLCFRRLSVCCVVRAGSKETAFIYAVTSAGVVHAVTQACSSGNLTDCSCDSTGKGLETPEGWKWGGCR